MANFNYGIDCPDTDSAEALMTFIESVDIYQDGLDVDEERVSVITKQGMIETLKEYAKSNSIELNLEVWPDDMEYDEAEENGDMEYYTFV